MPGVPEGWPTLSQLRSSDFGYFGQLADYLERISPKAQTYLEQLAEDVKRPGGVDWEGEAGDAAIAQAGLDVVKARPYMWGWDNVAASARRWQDELEAGKRLALDAADDAHRDGFRVNDDYSLTDTRQAKTRAQYEERLADATSQSNFIRSRVGTLVSNESRINAELKTMTAEWGTLSFGESPLVALAGSDTRPLDGATVFCWELAPMEFHCEWMFHDGYIIEYPSNVDHSGGWGGW